MRTLILIIFVFVIQFSSLAQTTYTSQGGGGPFFAIPFSPFGTPGATDTVILDNNTFIFESTNVQFAKLILKDASSIVLYSGNSITVDSLILEGSASGSNISLTPGIINAQHIVFKGTSSSLAAIQFNHVASELNLSGSIFFQPYGQFSGSQNSNIDLTGGSTDQSIGSPSKATNLDLSAKTGGTVSLNYNTTFGSAVTVPSAVTLDNGGFSISGSTLTVSDGATLKLSGTSSFPSSTTTLSSGATVEYSGAAQTIDGRTYENLVLSGSGDKTASSGTIVTDALTVNGSANLVGGGNITLQSNSSGTARLANSSTSGTITGLVVQRYVSDKTSTGNPGWWYFLGAPVSGQTIATIDDDISTTGFTGSDFPSSTFKSVTRWTGSAYTDATNTSQAMSTGEGWFVYMGSSDPTYDIPVTIDWQGDPHIGDFVYSTSGDATLSSTTNEYTSLSNPYPSAVNIDITSMPNNNVGNPYSVAADGSFTELTGSTTLGLGEGFFLQTTGASPSLTFRESDKVTTQEANSVFNKSGKSSASSSSKPRLTLFTTKVNGVDDYCYLQLDDTKTLGIEYPYDFDKYENYLGYTNVFFKMSGHDVHINNIPSNIGSGVSIPIHLSRAYPGNVNVSLPFRIEGVEDFKNNGICMTLENSNTKTTIALDKDYSTTLNWNDTDTNAIFILHLTQSFVEASTDASCYGFDDGTVSANLNTTAKYDFYLTNLIGDTLQSEMGFVGSSYTFNNVNAGDYKVVVNDPNGCGMIARPVEVTEPSPVISLFTTKENEVDLSFNPNITFNNISANAQNYFWRFGDGNTSSDMSPTHAYQDTGLFSVEMIALNGTCTDTSAKAIKVMKSGSDVGLAEINENPYLNLLQHNEKIEVHFDLPNREAIDARLINALGQTVWSSFGQTIQNEQIRLDLPKANTFYILNIKGETFETNYKLIRR